MNLTFSEILLTIIAIAIAIIAVKITISFDFNKFQKRRDEKMRLKAQNLCPHARIVKTENDEMAIQSTMISPSGTLQYICQQCQMITHTNNMESLKYYQANPKELMDATEKFQKHLKKMGIV